MTIVGEQGCEFVVRRSAVARRKTERNREGGRRIVGRRAQCGFAANAVRPHQRRDLVFTERRTASLDEREQKIECPAADVHLEALVK